MTTKKKPETTEPLKLKAFRLAEHHTRAVKKLSRQFTKSRKEKTSESQIVREAIEAFEYQNI